MRFASSREWLPWVLAGLPAFIAFFLPDLLPDGNFRSSGRVVLFAVTPAIYFVLLLIKRPWRARPIVLRYLGTAALLILGLSSVFGAVAGIPEFLEAQFGLFISVNDFGPRAIVVTPDRYVAVYVVKTSGTKGEPLKRATWTLTGSGSSQICQPPFG